MLKVSRGAGLIDHLHHRIEPLDPGQGDHRIGSHLLPDDFTGVWVQCASRDALGMGIQANKATPEEVGTSKSQIMELPVDTPSEATGRDRRYWQPTSA